MLLPLEEARIFSPHFRQRIPGKPLKSGIHVQNTGVRCRIGNDDPVDVTFKDPSEQYNSGLGGFNLRLIMNDTVDDFAPRNLQGYRINTNIPNLAAA